MTDHRAVMAARNNADWYAMMFDVHGLRYRRSAIAFLGIDSPPPYHSAMTTLDPEARDDLLALVRRNAHRPGFGAKDAFDVLPLADEGFAALFSASWIFADAVLPADTDGWSRIESVDDLARWEAAWKTGGSPSDRRQFPDAILERDDVVIWGRRAPDGFDAGVIANVSEDCVGLSNCFGRNACPAAATLCGELACGELPIVGYERGDDLAAVLDLGFSATGTLRIWNKP